jgi:hypothetical protein
MSLPQGSFGGILKFFHLAVAHLTFSSLNTESDPPMRECPLWKPCLIILRFPPIRIEHKLLRYNHFYVPATKIERWFSSRIYTVTLLAKLVVIDAMSLILR